MKIRLTLIMLLAIVMVSLLSAGCGTALASSSPGPVSLIQDQVALPTGTMANDLPPPTIIMGSDTIVLESVCFESPVTGTNESQSIVDSQNYRYIQEHSMNIVRANEVLTTREIWQANIGKLFSQDAEYEVHEFTNGGG